MEFFENEANESKSLEDEEEKNYPRMEIPLYNINSNDYLSIP